MKIAILTMFRTLRSTYSLVHVVEEQLKILITKGHDIRIIVSEGCPEEERYGIYLSKDIEWVKITNTHQGIPMEWHDYSQERVAYHNGFEQEVACIEQALYKALEDREVCLIHDILFQGKHYVHNCAFRGAKKRLGGLGCIVFTHSWPVPPQQEHIDYNRFRPLENALYSFPTHCGIRSLARQYQVPEGRCRVVTHTVPIIEDMTEMVHTIHKRCDVLSPDVLIVYPARLTEGKGIDKVIKLGGAIKYIGNLKVKIILCDSGETMEALQYKELVKRVADEYGLENEDVIFLSELQLPIPTDRGDILSLFRISDLYICPSQSESFGLGVIEAARNGNLLVLNENVPALKELGRQLGAYFMKWDARGDNVWHTEVYPQGEAAYYGKEAKNIINQLYTNPISIARRCTRQRFNYEWMYTEQLECMIHESIQLCNKS